jgi:hypothetical protein
MVRMPAERMVRTSAFTGRALEVPLYKGPVLELQTDGGQQVDCLAYSPDGALSVRHSAQTLLSLVQSLAMPCAVTFLVTFPCPFSVTSVPA